MTQPAYAVPEIEIGTHITKEIGGYTFNLDTIFATVVAGLIVIGLGLLMRRRLSAGVPGGPQLFFETVTRAIERQVESTMGIRTAPFVVPLAITLFCFILAANWLTVLPVIHKPELLPPPTSDVNLTYALALLVIVGMHVTGIRKKGLRGYYGHLAKPHWVMTPINIIEEIAKPITLALRLFGNMFSGVIMISLIALFPAWLMWGPTAAWKLFDLFIGLIQAFIFALLTILYFGSVAPEEEGAH